MFCPAAARLRLLKTTLYDCLLSRTDGSEEEAGTGEYK